ncbi:MAG: hypothetical protein WC378_10935 [Opitutaceae bacterium]|jgi:hypothetical protein
MLVLSLSIILFAIFACVGKATLSALRYRRGALKSWLLAPSIGLSVVLFGLMIGNQAGLPIRSFAWAWATVLACGTGLVFYRKKPWGGITRLTPYALAALAFLLIAGWPAFIYGLNWVSYSNDDMANYCLAAERFADHEFFSVPTAVEVNLRDYAQTYWYMHASDLMRFGSEHILAWVASLTGLKATHIFMPVILALACAQLFAAAALVMYKGRFRRWSIVAAWILAVSPLFMLGTLYQLIAQVGGLALLLACLSLLTEKPHARPTIRLAKEGVIVALPAAALCIYYPEVTPFVVLSFGGFLLVRIAQDRKLPYEHLRRSIYALTAVVILLNHNLISYLYTLSNQAGVIGSQVDLSLSLFPFFLIPSGTANLFGFMPISWDFAEPYSSVAIIAGMAGVVTMLVTFMVGCRRGYPIALLGLVQAVLAAHLFQSGNDFGLFKLAMFLQPALAGAGAWLLISATKNRCIQAACVAAYACVTFPSGHFYSSSSCGLRAGGLTELRFASALGLEIKADIPKPAKILSTLDNVVGAKFAASELRGHDVAFASRDFFAPGLRLDYRRPGYVLELHPFFKQLSQAPDLARTHEADYMGNAMIWKTSFNFPKLASEPDYYLVTSPKLSLFNKFGLDPKTSLENLFRLVPAKEMHNYVFFVHSGRGHHYYLGDRRRVALYQQEKDPGQTDLDFAGIGRFMLLRIANPSEEFYLRISATRTYSMPRMNWSNKAQIQGDKDYPMGLSGSGAFNKIVGPIRPYWLNGAAYLAIDFNEIPKTMTDDRSGLRALYSMNVPRDFRRLAGWGRDISALSPEQYRALSRPTRVSSFPDDLTKAHGLEFTGAYEDGWLGSRSTWTLGNASRGALLHVKGQVPGLPGLGGSKATLKIKVNGSEEFTLPAPQGDFDHLIPIGKPGNKTDVEMVFDHTALLPNGDLRDVGGRLSLMEIAAPSSTLWNTDPENRERLSLNGVDADGWAASEISTQLPSLNRKMTLVMLWEFPGWAGATETELSFALQNVEPQHHILRPGKTEIRMTLPASDDVRSLRIAAKHSFPMPAPDTRQRAARLLSMELVTEESTETK